MYEEEQRQKCVKHVFGWEAELSKSKAAIEEVLLLPYYYLINKGSPALFSTYDTEY